MARCQLRCGPGTNKDTVPQDRHNSILMKLGQYDKANPSTVDTKVETLYVRFHFFLAMAAAVSIFTAIYPTTADTGETIVTLTAQAALGLTIYNDNLALARDLHTAPLHSG